MVRTRWVAALFVERFGVYFDGQRDMFRPRLYVDAWDRLRDARDYPGPHPVVAHPPCGPWGHYARNGMTKAKLGEDDGCFAAALASCRRWGGVLEHPASSSAWAWFDLPAPPDIGWSEPDAHGGRSASVEQGHYGHTARKPTWLYACKLATWPQLPHGSAKTIRPCQSLSHIQRAATPPDFRDLLIDMAKSVPRDERDPVDN